MWPLRRPLLCDKTDGTLNNPQGLNLVSRTLIKNAIKKLRSKVHTLISTDSVIYMPALVEMREGDKSLVPNQFLGAYD